jgi:dephospho-CoA kinase
MISVGITGNFASGKSFILQCLNSLGFKTFSADEFVRELYQEESIQKQILQLIPNLETFDKVKIAELIYNDLKSREKIQNFIHPLVIKNLEAFKQHNKATKCVFAEIPLLFEANFDKYFDFIIVTICSEESRLNRARKRDSFNKEIYDKIGEIQLSQDEKVKRADFVINTETNQVELEEQVAKLIKILRKLNERINTRY